MKGFDEDTFDDVTTLDTGMPSPERATISREDFEAGEEPEFEAITARDERDAEMSVATSLYSLYSEELSLGIMYRYFAAKATMLELSDAVDIFLDRSDTTFEHAEELLTHILQTYDDDPAFGEISSPPYLGDGEDTMGLFINMVQSSIQAEQALADSFENMNTEDSFIQASATEHRTVESSLVDILEQLTEDEEDEARETESHEANETSEEEESEHEIDDDSLEDFHDEQD